MEDYRSKIPKPHIGKNVIETLTLGMYENAHFIYREYVQNAADQIDVAVEEGILDKKSAGQINISIDKENKTICIEDNATGIKSKDVLQFLGDVANSQKDRTKRKGFRGIGRLGGLGYCQTLIFETSYQGEVTKSIISLNAKQLKLIIEDGANTMDAATVISVITSLKKEEEIADKHYFKVKLIDVTKDELLDEKGVKDYLSMVAPIPFHENFTFGKNIHEYFNKNNVKIEEYDVHLSLNDEKLFKAYKINIFDKKESVISEISSVNFFNIRDDDNELIAVGWYGISELLNVQVSSNNYERGIRLRKNNIGIGSETTLSKFYGQPRQNLNYIGEVYALSNLLVPNARRDYFNDSKTCQIFEQKLKDFLPTLGSLTNDSSALHNRKNDILSYKKELKKFNLKLENQSLTVRQKERKEDELKRLKKKASSSKEIINKLHEKSINNSNLQIIYDSIIGESNLNFEGKEVLKGENITFQITLSQLNTNEKKIVREIFSILEDNLSLNEAELLKKKIAERYN